MPNFDFLIDTFIYVWQRGTLWHLLNKRNKWKYQSIMSYAYRVLETSIVRVNLMRKSHISYLILKSYIFSLWQFPYVHRASNLNKNDFNFFKIFFFQNEILLHKKAYLLRYNFKKSIMNECKYSLFLLKKMRIKKTKSVTP